jgi:hypothetical protein
MKIMKAGEHNKILIVESDKLGLKEWNRLVAYSKIVLPSKNGMAK